MMCGFGFEAILYCMSYRVPPLTYRRTPSSHKDRKGSFTTRPTGKVPGYKNVIKKGLLFTATSMLAQYQQGGRRAVAVYLKVVRRRKSSSAEGTRWGRAREGDVPLSLGGSGGLPEIFLNF